MAQYLWWKKEDVGKSIDAFSDNSFLLTCETESFGKGKKDIWLLKIDSNGKIIWENTLGGKKMISLDQL